MRWLKRLLKRAYFDLTQWVLHKFPDFAIDHGYTEVLTPEEYKRGMELKRRAAWEAVRDRRHLPPPPLVVQWWRARRRH